MGTVFFYHYKVDGECKLSNRLRSMFGELCFSLFSVNCTLVCRAHVLCEAFSSGCDWYSPTSTPLYLIPISLCDFLTQFTVVVGGSGHGNLESRSFNSVGIVSCDSC